MAACRREAGFTLIEVLVVVGMIVVIVATLGTFMLAGPSPAVASASRDIEAAFDEARETAIAFAESTVVFTPSGTGYSARVYRAMPGDPQFQATNGPTYDSTVDVAESAAPLGAPGFAFRIDSRGTVVAYQHFHATDTTFTERDCPASGTFRLDLAYNRQKQTVLVPCRLSLTSETPAVLLTAAPALTPPPSAPGTCGPGASCIAQLPGFTATCPPGYTPDAQPYVCDSPSPTPPAHQSQLVCSTDPRAGTTDFGSNPPVDFVGTIASPPCMTRLPPVAVCSTQSPNTDLGPDPDGLHEDVAKPCTQTVCNAIGNANFDPRAGTKDAQYTYVGTSSTPPCSGRMIHSVCNTDSRIGSTDSNGAVYVGNGSDCRVIFYVNDFKTACGGGTRQYWFTYNDSLAGFTVTEQLLTECGNLGNPDVTNGSVPQKQPDWPYPANWSGIGDGMACQTDFDTVDCAAYRRDILIEASYLESNGYSVMIEGP